METPATWLDRDQRDVDKFVGARLRLRRNLLGHTQSDLGAALELTYQQIQKYETGASRINAGRLWALAQALNVPVSYFFDGLDDHIRQPDQATGDILGQSLGDREQRLCRALRTLPSAQQKCLFDLVSTFAGDGVGTAA